MRRWFGYAVGFLAVGLFLTVSAQGQSTFTYGVAGPASLSGNEGTAVEAQYEATLANAGGDPALGGAQGWSFGLQVEGATVLSATTTGTAADPANGYYSGGFNKTEVIEPAKNEGKQGLVSAIVLSFTEDKRLPVDATQVVCKGTISATMPAVGVGDAFARLAFTDGLKGAGQPVACAVTEAGETRGPVLGQKIVALRAIQSCCGKDLNVGFSGEKVSSAEQFAGIAGDGPEGTCLASGGSIDTEVPEGETGLRNVYANVISNLKEPPEGTGGAQGWSFSIALDGDVNLLVATTAGTSVDTYYSGGFNKTQIVDPDTQPIHVGQRGAVSAIVLSFTEVRQLPVVSTESVLELQIQAASAQGEADIVGALKFLDDLKGAGQPVRNAITVNGATAEACNFDDAATAVVFKKKIITDRFFVRGNPNGDDKVDIADPIWIINALFRSGPGGDCDDASDINNDNVVDSSDAVYLIDYLFRGGSPPPEPFGVCGIDPEKDEDGVTCATDICTP